MTPRSTISASSDCSSTASGVVCPAGRASVPMRYWTVPMRPVVRPPWRSERIDEKDVVVLPLVPVMPMTVSAREGWPIVGVGQARERFARGRHEHAAARRCRSSRSAPSSTTAVAPRASASST